MDDPSQPMEHLLRKPDVGIEDLLLNQNLQYEYRMKNQKVIDIVLQPSSIHTIIKTLQTTQDFRILKRAIGIFISPNTMLLQAVSKSVNLMESFFRVLEKPNDYHRYVIGSIINIMARAFDLFFTSSFDSILNSKVIINMIAMNLDIPSVFNFLTKVVIKSFQAQPICWHILRILLGGHGLGCNLPQRQLQFPFVSQKLPSLFSEQRQPAIASLCVYFNEFQEEDELFETASTALPLLMQDADSESERATVFRLGLLLRPNAALGYCAVSVVNAFTCGNELVCAALQYIQQFDVMIGPRSVELFIYRLLHKQSPNNFVLLAAARMVANCVRLQGKDDELGENVKQVAIHCFRASGLPLLVRAFKGTLILAAKGIDADPISQPLAISNATRDAQNITTDPDIEDRIRDYRSKARAIDEGRSKITPIFDARTLWRSDAMAMSHRYRTINRIAPQKMPVQKKPVQQHVQSQKSTSKTSTPKPVLQQQQQQRVPQQKPQKTHKKEMKRDDSIDMIFLEEIEVTEPVESYFNRFRELEAMEALEREGKDGSYDDRLPPSNIASNDELKPLPKSPSKLASDRKVSLKIDIDSYKEKLPASPVKNDDKPLRGLMMSPRAHHRRLSGDDDITLDIPAPPPAMKALNACVTIDEEREDIRLSVERQLALIRPKSESTRRYGKIKSKKLVIEKFDDIGFPSSDEKTL